LEALNAELEDRVAERTRDLAAANEKLRSEIAERERVGEQVRQLQKMEALGQLTGGIAHDFNNLLTAILGGLEVTRRRTEDPRSLKLIDSSISAAQRGAKLIAQLMAFARKQNLQVEYLPLNALVRDMQELLERSVGATVRMVYDMGPDVWPVMADASQVQTALLNLAINARDAMPNGGRLRIATGNICVEHSGADLSAGDYAALIVQDDGTGMTEAVQARLFEPFFTTKDVGKGTGLGLAQVYGFVRQSGGTVRVNSAVGEGSMITILLPRAIAAAVQQEMAEEREQTGSTGGDTAAAPT
jgi:signal transduction histidine kinase